METFRAPFARAAGVLLFVWLGVQPLSACSDAVEGGAVRSADAGTGGDAFGEPDANAGGKASGGETVAHAGKAQAGAGAASVYGNGGSGGNEGDGHRAGSSEGGAPPLSSAGVSSEGGAPVVSNAGASGAPDSAHECGELGESGAGGDAGLCSGLHGCPEPIVVGPSSKAWGVTLDEAYVYWTTLDVLGSVLRAPLDGGTIETIASDEPRPFDIAVARGMVFWCTLDATGHVVKAPATGGARESLATGVASGVGRVKSDGENVYYLTNFNLVMTVPVAGGTPVALSLGPTRSNIVDLALSEGQLYWANSGVWNTSYTLKEPATAGIARVSVSGTPSPSALVTQLDFPQFEIAVDDAHVFWSDQKSIYRTGLLGGAFTVVASLTDAPVSAVLPTLFASPIVDLVSDGCHVYFADAHNVYRVPISGGTPRVVSWGWSGIQQLAVNESAVYFTDGVAGVVKMAK